MAVQNFIPNIWSHKIQKALEMQNKLAAFCTNTYTGDFQYAGSITILSVPKPVISGYHDNVTYKQLNDSGQQMTIDFQDYFAFSTRDLDKLQSIPGLADETRRQAAVGLANRADINIGRLIAGKCVSTVTEGKAANNEDGMSYEKTTDTELHAYKDYFALNEDNEMERVPAPVLADMDKYYEIKSPKYETGAKHITKATGKTQTAIKTAIDSGIVELQLRNCTDGLRIELDPESNMTFKNQLVDLSTNNAEMIRKGIVGMYNNYPVVTSNAIYNDETTKYCDIRTKNAIAYVDRITETESMRLEKKFGDGVRGLHVYGMKIIDQEQLQRIDIPA